MIFRGNAIWHLRENPANTTNLYIKLNSFNCDPLGEDPYSEDVRKRTLASLSQSDDALKRFIPLLGRRVDYVHRQHSRQWDETMEVVFWGDRTLPVSPDEFELLQHLSWKNTVGAIVMIADSRDAGTRLAAVRRLASHGAIDLFEPGRN
jgi:hypothetical protein